VIRIYSPNEIPKGFRETLINNNVSLDTVDFLIHEDYNCNNIWSILIHFDKYKALSTISEDWIYVIFK
jgi:hypothetical protein